MTIADRFSGVRTGAALKAPCRVATTANIALLRGLLTIDGATLAEGDRVLVKNQTTTAENGIYVASTGNWSRAKDFNGTGDVYKGTRVYVHSGSVGRAEYELTTSDPITIGTTGLTFSLSDPYTVMDASVAAAEAAQAAAEAAQALAETARTQAQTAETNAETAETNAELAETNAEAAQAAAEAAQAAAEAARDEAQSLVDGNALSAGAYPSTAAALGNGIQGSTSLVGGSGGTNGTFALVASGGTEVLPVRGYFVVSGGAVTSIVVLHPGYYTSNPTGFTFSASSGLTGASATPVMGANVGVGEFFSVPVSDSSDALIIYEVTAGPAATEVTRVPSSTQITAATSSNIFADPHFDVAAGDDSLVVHGRPVYDATYNNRVWVPDYAHSMGRGAWKSEASSSNLIGFNTHFGSNVAAGDYVSFGVVLIAAASTDINIGARFFAGAPTNWVGAQFGTTAVTATGAEQTVTVAQTVVPSGCTGVSFYLVDGTTAGDFHVLAHWCNLNADAGTRPPARMSSSVARQVLPALLGDLTDSAAASFAPITTVSGTVSAVTTATVTGGTDRSTLFVGWGDVYTTPGSISFNAVRLPTFSRGDSAPTWSRGVIVVRTHATAPQTAGATLVAVGTAYIDPDAVDVTNPVFLLRDPLTGELLTVTEADLDAEFAVMYYAVQRDGTYGICNDVLGTVTGITRAGRSYYVLASTVPELGTWTTYSGNPSLAIELLDITSPVETIGSKPRQAFAAQMGIATSQFTEPTPTEPIMTERVFGMVGLELPIYYKGMHSGLTPRGYDVTSTLGNDEESRWVLTPSTTASGTAWSCAVKDLDQGSTYGTATTALHIASNTAAAAAAVRVHCIGDSTSDGVGDATASPNEGYTARLLALSAAYPSAVQITLMGTRGSGSNKRDGFPGWTVDAFYQQATFNTYTNPFIVSPATKFSYADYLTAQSTTAADVVVIHLGINDVFSATADTTVDATAAAMITKLEEMIGISAGSGVDSIWSSNPSAAIILALPISPSQGQTAFGDDYGSVQTYQRYYRNIKKLAYLLNEHFSGMTGDNVWLLPWHVTVDPVYGFPYTSVAPNVHSAESVRRPNNGVHPSAVGYKQMGDQLFAAINWLKINGHI